MSLKQQGANASKWTTLSTVFMTVIQFVQLAVLSRLLQPSDFGLMGMISVVVGFAQIYSDVGVSNAILSKQEISKNELSSLYYLNVLSGVLVFVIVLGLSPLISLFYHEPRLTLPLIWIALIFVILPIGQQFQVLFQKELLFNRLAKFDIISSGCGFLTAVTAAYFNYGVYSLVGGQIAVSLVKTACLVIAGVRLWKPKFHFKRIDLHGFIRFGMYQMGEKTIHFFSMNFDYILIGKFFGATTLGYYTFAYQLAILPVLKINPIITQVTVPIFSKFQSQRDRLRNGYLKMLHYLSLINFPLYFGLIILSPFLIPVVFGSKWVESIVLIQLLAGMSMLRSTISPNSSLLLSIGRVDKSFYWTLTSMAVLIPGISIGAYLGQTIGIAVSYIIIQSILFALNYYLIIRKVLDPCLRVYLDQFKYPFVISSIMLVVVWFIQYMLGSSVSLLPLIIQLGTGIVVYFVCNLLLNRQIMNEFLRLLLNKDTKLGVS